MIGDYIKKLRRAADVLEELLTSNPFENPKAAKALSKQFDANLADEKRPHALKGRKFNGTHWTQQPENAAKVAANASKGGRIARAKQRETLTGTAVQVMEGKRGTPGAKFSFAPGQHWTQRPENREKLAKMVAKSVRKNKAKWKAVRLAKGGEA